MKKITLIFVVALILAAVACSGNKAPVNSATPADEPVHSVTPADEPVVSAEPPEVPRQTAGVTSPTPGFGDGSGSTDVRNGQESDIEEWESENKLSRPWAEDNPDYLSRFIGLGQVFYEAEESEESLIRKLINDNEKMALYQ